MTISLPAGLLPKVDCAARARGESRSQFVRRLLVEAVCTQPDVDFTARLNDFFAGRKNLAAHRKEARAWAHLRPAWGDERREPSEGSSARNRS